MVKTILFDIENTLLCPEVPAVQRFAALRLHGEPLFTETTAREAVRQAELWTARGWISAFSSRRICPRSRAGRCMRSRSSPRLQRCRMQEAVGENSFSALRIEFSLEKLQIFPYNISERFMCGACRVEIYSKGV